MELEIHHYRHVGCPHTTGWLPEMDLSVRARLALGAVPFSARRGQRGTNQLVEGEMVD